MLSFIWDYKTHRIGKDHLCKPKLNGGLALPNFCHYYWASNIRSLAYWLDDSALLPDGLEMEREDCLPFTIGAVILSPVALNKKIYNKNPIIHSAVRIWKQITNHFKLRGISFLLPIAANPSFAPSALDNTFLDWREKGLNCIGDLYIEGIFASFVQLKGKYDLPQRDFFRYLQIRSYVRKHIPDFETARPDKLDGSLKQAAETSHIISYLYDSLHNMVPVSTDSIKAKWETELGVQLAEDIWKESLEYIHTCSINTRHCLIQFKILHRLHYSKEKLHKIFPNISPQCDKCNAADATLLHSYALCPNLQNFWIEIFRLFSRILEVEIDPDPVLVILGVSEGLKELRGTQQRLLSYGLITAKKLILLFWKKKEVPTVKMWLSEMTETLHLERIRFSLRDKLGEFEKIWRPLLSYLRG